jgi:hypothetical protein
VLRIHDFTLRLRIRNKNICFDIDLMLRGLLVFKWFPFPGSNFLLIRPRGCGSATLLTYTSCNFNFIYLIFSCSSWFDQQCILSEIEINCLIIVSFWRERIYFFNNFLFLFQVTFSVFTQVYSRFQDFTTENVERRFTANMGKICQS